LPRGFPIAFGHFPAAFLYPLAVQQLLGSFPSNWQLKCGNFHLCSLKDWVSVKIYLKSKEHLEILKNTSGSSSRTDLSSKTSVSQSQSHATLPLKWLWHKIFYPWIF
jgi:hypothetical protein